MGDWLNVEIESGVPLLKTATSPRAFVLVSQDVAAHKREMRLLIVVDYS